MESIQFTSSCGINFRTDGKALHQAHDLLFGQLSNFSFIVRPSQLPVLKAFMEQSESLAVPIKCFEAISSAAAEEKDISREGIEIEALLNYVSKRINSPAHVGLTANNEHSSNSARLIMAQEPAHDFDHKLVSGITVKWQLNPFGLQIKDKPVLWNLIPRLDSALRQLERYDWMLSHNIVFLRIQLLRTVYDY